MKIISLNVNNFGGLNNKPLLKKYQSNHLNDWTSWNIDVDNWRLKYANEISCNVVKIVSLITDYALSTPSLLSSRIEEKIIDSIRLTKNTDHSAISVSL